MKVDNREAYDVVDYVLGVLLSSDSDAGYHGPHIIKMLMDFQGDLPGSSGIAKSSTKMIEEMKYLRPYNKKRFKLYADILIAMDDKCLLCIMMERFYEGRRYDDGQRYSAMSIAAQCGMNVETYKKKKAIGWSCVKAILNVYKLRDAI